VRDRALTYGVEAGSEGARVIETVDSDDWYQKACRLDIGNFTPARDVAASSRVNLSADAPLG
jgi:hypothetical protein